MDWFLCVCVCVFVLHGLQSKKTPLHNACCHSDNAAVVGLLLDRGADPSAKYRVSVISPHTCTHHMRFTRPMACSASLMCGVVLHRALVVLLLC